MGYNKIARGLLLVWVILFSGCGNNSHPQVQEKSHIELQSTNEINNDDTEYDDTDHDDTEYDDTDQTSSSINFNIAKEEGVNTIDARPFLEKKLFEQELRSGGDGITDSAEQSESIDSDNPIKEDKLEYTKVIAGIIPHHTVAHEMIHQFYVETSKNNRYDLIIVVSPNHSSLGPRFQVGMRDYLTYEGIVSIDKTLSKTLIDETIAVEAEDEVIEKEHGQLVHMHYIRHYFKDVPVVSILINETRKYNDIESFRDQLVEVIQDKKVLLIGSIDFSHYLTLDAANKNDEITKNLLQTNNSRQMISQSNDYIDSPSTYALLIEVMQSLTEFEPKIVAHDNSATILQQKALKETTSYFSVVYVTPQIK